MSPGFCLFLFLLIPTTPNPKLEPPSLARGKGGRSIPDSLKTETKAERLWCRCTEHSLSKPCRTCWARGFQTSGSVEPLGEMHFISQLSSHRIYWRLQQKLHETILTLLPTIHSYLSSWRGYLVEMLVITHSTDFRVMTHSLETTDLGSSQHSACLVRPEDAEGDCLSSGVQGAPGSNPSPSHQA